MTPKLFDTVAGLPVDIDAVTTETNEIQVREDFPRKTTTVRLTGGDATGLGEDVIYETALHEYPDGLESRLTGSYEFASFSARLAETDLFGEGVDPDGSQANYRRWAVESAALDLALEQQGTTLAGALAPARGRDHGQSDQLYRPVRFVVSPSTDDNALDELRQWMDRVPGIEFKLDAKAEWDRDLVAKLAALDRVRVVDFKSHYEGFGRDPDYELYSTVAEGFDDVLLEDPKLTPDTRPAFDGREHRVAWDKPITGVESVEALPFTPGWLNVKPSRFGSVRALLDTVDYCRDHGIDTYGGGQFELDVGRQHIQALASLFYPDAPNDVAPRCYNGPDVPENPPRSPLHPDHPLGGFEWRYRR